MATGKAEVCFVCDDKIKESNGKSKGQPALFCEGLHKRWAHAGCVDVSNELYHLLNECDSPWLCPQCVRYAITSISDIANLKAEFSQLSKQNSSLQNETNALVLKVTSLESRLNELSQSSADALNLGDTVSTPPIHASGGMNSPPISVVPQAQVKPQSPPYNSIPRKERKFNLVVFGVDECPKGTSRSKRLESDEQVITTHIKGSVPSFTSLSIRDCYRLGRYSESSSRPRPVLISLDRVSLVQQILSKRLSLSTNTIRIKPDLSPEERHIASIVLSERKSLIESGSVVDKTSIKIRGPRLFIGRRLHGEVINGTFHRSNSLGNHAPILHNLSASSDSGLTSQSPPSTHSTQESNSQI